jgi:hypothetical protein
MSSPPTSGPSLHQDHSPGTTDEGAAGEGTAAAPAGAHDGEPSDGDPGVRRLMRRPAVAITGLALLLLLPLVVALVVLRSPRWYPVLDLAMTELRVRDVGSRQTPLIGLPGRIGGIGLERGSHPGPLSFWLLAPTYRLLGAQAWGMQVGSVVVHAGAVAAALWLAFRRAGLPLVAGVAAVLAVLMRAYGAEILTEPWNPYLPVLWWFALLLAVWSVLCRDLVALPVAVAAASLCVQTHIPYAPVVGGMAVLAVAGVVHAVVQADGARRRRLLGWVAAAAVLGALAWAPPLVDQLRRDPGNLAKIVEHFRSPSEEVAGLARGVELTLVHLDPWSLLTGTPQPPETLVASALGPSGSVVPGLVVLLAWTAAAVAAWRLRHGALLRLHVVVGAGIALSVVGISRIFGQTWYYLMLWAWGIGALTVLATAWTAGAWFAGRRTAPGSHPGSGGVAWATPATAVLAAVAVVGSASFAIAATGAEVPATREVRTLAQLVPPVIDALADGAEPGTGPDGRYLVTWDDTLYIGSQGVALVNELERAGLDVGAAEAWGVPVVPWRVRRPDQASAVVHLANGPAVERWRETPGAREIASFEPRSPAEVAEYERLRARLLALLEGAGLDERLADVDLNLFRVAIEPGLPPNAHAAVSRMLELGLPTSVFVGPTEALR